MEKFYSFVSHRPEKKVFIAQAVKHRDSQKWLMAAKAHKNIKTRSEDFFAFHCALLRQNSKVSINSIRVHSR